MITRAELVAILYQGCPSVIDRLVRKFNYLTDYEFIEIYYRETGHRLKLLRKNLYYV